MKKICFLGLLLGSLAGFSQEEWEGKSVDFSHGKLAVSENKRFLEFKDGTETLPQVRLKVLVRPGKCTFI